MTVGIAILGAGIFATDAHLPALAPLIASKEAALVAVYSRSAKTAQTFVDAAQNTIASLSEIPVYSDDSGADRTLDDLLKRQDVHAVVVVLPILTQPDVIRKALAAGKHVLSEKPVAKDVATGVQLIKEVEGAYSSDVIWRVAENFEAETSYLRARQAVADGSIGDLVMFNLSTVNFLDQTGKYYKTPWRTVPEYQGGFLLDGGVHSAAIVRMVLGEKHALESLSGHATLTKEFLAPHDTIQAVFRTRAGATGIFELSFAAPQASRAGTLITITGTKGWIKIEPIKIEVDGVLKPGNRVTLCKLVDGNKEETQSWDEVNVGVRNEYASFIAAISSKRAAKTDIGDLLIGQPREMLKDVALIQAALTSNGKQVLFDELLQGL